MTIFQVDLGKLVQECLHSEFYWEDNSGGGENRYMTCKAQVNVVTTNKPRHPAFYRPNALPVAQPIVSKQSFVNTKFPNCYQIHEGDISLTILVKLE